MATRDPQEDAPQTSSSRSIEDFATLARRVLQAAGRGTGHLDFLREACRELLAFSACDRVELRIHEGDQYQVGRLSRPGDVFEFRHRDWSRALLEAPDEHERRCLSLLQAVADQGTVRAVHLPAGSGPDDGATTRLLIPAAFGPGTCGLVVFAARAPEAFGPGLRPLCEGLAPIVGEAWLALDARIALRERVKELTCLYGIAQVARRPQATLHEVLQGIAELLPPACLHPAIAAGRIVVDGHACTTVGFRETGQRLAGDIVVGEQHRGAVEVVYLEETGALDEGPFLREERHLIDTVAREIALVVEGRQAEEEKDQLAEQLRHADRLASIGRLAAGVAHELSEPLGAVIGFAQLARRASRLPRQVAQDLDKIIEASLHAREVIKGLLEFARPMPPRRLDLDLNEVVDRGLSFLEARCAKEDIRIVRDFGKDLPRLQSDPSRIQQVLVNLVVNAIQAMPHGGTLGIRTVARDGSVVLAVEDTGVGMSDEVLAQIFLPFFTTREAGRGTGLGLALVQGITQSLGGSIQAWSQPGQGSRFEVLLPAGNHGSTEEP